MNSEIKSEGNVKDKTKSTTGRINDRKKGCLDLKMEGKCRMVDMNVLSGIREKSRKQEVTRLSRKDTVNIFSD